MKNRSRDAASPTVHDAARDFRLRTYGGLFTAVLAVSWASILIRWCGDVPALILSFYRMLWSTVIFAVLSGFTSPAASTSTDPARLSGKRPAMFMLLAGLFLALHFATWIASLQLTTVAHSLTLESTHPVFALLLSPLLLKERGGWQTYAAVAVTLAGIALIAWQDAGIGGTDPGSRLLGDFLAVAGALFVTLYIFIARYLRREINLRAYLFRVYGTATVVLLLLCVTAGHELLRYSPKIHLLMLLLAVIPTGIGHSLFNWAARRIEAYKVSLAVLGEPVLASVMAYFFFREVPHGWFYAGALLIVTGIVIALRAVET